jgi:hypothetical protein
MNGGSRWITSTKAMIQVPVLIPGKHGKAQTCIRKMHVWLLTVMREEAVRRDDEWTPALFERESPGKMPQGSVDALNDYIFDGAVEIP